METLLTTNDLCMHYKGAGNYLAVYHMNLQLPRGRVVGLLGPNGCGKSTLFRLIGGLLVPTCGSVLIGGLSPCTETKKIISYLPEHSDLPNNRRVEEMIAYFEDFYEDFRPERAYDLLSWLRIDPNARIKTLSKDNQEKVRLILTMSREAQLYLLDEPLAAVEPAAKDYILKTVLTQRGGNATVLLATQLIADMEALLDDVIFMKNGSLLLHTSADALRAQQGKSLDAYYREVLAC